MHVRYWKTVNWNKAAYGVDSDAFKAEMMGSAITRNHNFISPEHIDLLRDEEASTVRLEDMVRTPPHYVFVSIDPSGSTRSKVDGETSDYAFVTAFVHKGSFVVHYFFINSMASSGESGSAPPEGQLEAPPNWSHILATRATSMLASRILPMA